MAETTDQTLSERLADDLAEAILAGELVPGSRLDENGLATRFGVSRTPVREALRQLSASGLIDSVPRRGATVKRVTSPQLEELFVAMGELEATCARLSALSMTPIERRRLEALHDHMSMLADRRSEADYAEANVEFHSSIYAGSHNAVIAEMAAGLRRRLSPFRRAQFRSAGRLRRSHSEHDVVVKAILKGDADSAHAAMLRHVSLVEDAFEKVSALVEPAGASASNGLVRKTIKRATAKTGHKKR